MSAGRFSRSSNVLPITWELILIIFLGSSIFIMLAIISILIIKLRRVKEKIQVQESVKRVQNLNNYYQLSSNKHKESADIYEEVYSDFLISKVASDNSKDVDNDSDPDNLYQSLETVRMCSNEDNRLIRVNNENYESDFISAAEPIDEALRLLKMSADQL